MRGKVGKGRKKKEEYVRKEGHEGERGGIQIGIHIRGKEKTREKRKTKRK